MLRKIGLKAKPEREKEEGVKNGKEIQNFCNKSTSLPSS